MSDNPIHRWRAGAVATSAPPGQNTRQGQIPRRAPVAPSHHSNAPIRQESQSILSKIVALMPRQLTSDSRQNPSAAYWTLTKFPVLAGNFPVLQNIFPVNLRREFRKKFRGVRSTTPAT